VEVVLHSRFYIRTLLDNLVDLVVVVMVQTLLGILVVVQ
jgi:hypothetical protein|tara:strand:+ start:390 stop:506 length:117 start_codon:yes stop_codon:yes gene_type:complete